MARAQNRAGALPVDVQLIAIESNHDLYCTLNSCCGQFGFARIVEGTFLNYLPEIKSLAATHSVFLYADPFTVEGLDWDAMCELFSFIKKGSSVEVLLNFNAASFVRRGLGALSRTLQSPDPVSEDLEEIDAASIEQPSVGKLNAVVGGSWWQDVLIRECSFDAKVQSLAEEYCKRLKDVFNVVCWHAVKALPHHTVPKYYLIFGSRHDDALRLMNDEMVKSRDTLANLATPEQPTLFETRSLELVPDSTKLPSVILQEASTRMTRELLIVKTIRRLFCEFKSAQIRSTIEDLLKSGDLVSANGKWRINDSIEVWRPYNPPAQ